MTPQEQTALLKEMHHLRDSRFVQYLKEKRQDILEQLGECPEEMSQQLRGKNLLLKELLSDIEGARKSLEKIEAGRPNMSKAF